jgi:replicative superfamily II helicase
MPIGRLRVFAASATVSNIEDVAAWLGPGCVTKRFDDSFRAVPLTWRVLTFPMNRVFTFGAQQPQRSTRCRLAACRAHPATVGRH